MSTTTTIKPSQLQRKATGAAHIKGSKVERSVEVARATKRDLERAADLLDASVGTLDEFGWLRGSFGDKKHGFCSLGAINFTAEKAKLGPRKYTVKEVATDALNSTAGLSVINFNDSYARDRRVIKAWFRKTAKSLRKLAAQR